MSLIHNTLPQHVKFISYTGKGPNLCSGVLTLEVDGVKYSFGSERGCEYKKFWESGGWCGFVGDNDDEDGETAPWVIDVSALPECLQPYAYEIGNVFNENVPYGCCGGCL